MFRSTAERPSPTIPNGRRQQSPCYIRLLARLEVRAAQLVDPLDQPLRVHRRVLAIPRFLPYPVYQSRCNERCLPMRCLLALVLFLAACPLASAQEVLADVPVADWLKRLEDPKAEN